jgi:hypothetical protein
VDGLLERDDRDAEPSSLDEVALDVVDPLRVRSCGVGGVASRRDLKAEDAVRVVVGGIVEVAGDHEQLPELFFERHAAEQVAHAHGDRPRRVAIRRALRRLAKRRARRREQRKRDRDD